MATSDILKDEEITLTYATWTFDPSVLTQDPYAEDVLRFPEEVEELFDEQGYAIFAREMEIFEPTEINGKSAFISDGVKPVAIITEDFDFSDAGDYGLDIDGSALDHHMIVPGGKVLFVQDDYLMFINDKVCIARSVLEAK